MSPTQLALDLIDEGAAHLHHAANAARRIGGEDSLSIWHAFAGQLELAALGLSPGTQADGGAAHGPMADSIRAAVSALESIPPLQGPPDLAMWIWHLAELRELAEEGDAL
jgi:hypothetical protein